MPPRPRIALKRRRAKQRRNPPRSRFPESAPSPERRRAKQCRRCAPQSAARLPSHARYGVRAVDRCIETQGFMAKPCTPHLHCAARAALQAANPQCRGRGGRPSPFSGGYKGGILFGKRIPPLSGSGVQRRMIHAARGKTRAFFKKPYSSICAARY